MRIGQGYDIHRIKPGKGKLLKLGGIVVDDFIQVVAFSDGDALAHAIIDAVFGAAGMGDIGSHFPDDDEQYKDADSLELLEKALKIIEPHGFIIRSIDATIILEKPKLGRKTRQMGANIAKRLGLPPHMVNIKAKTKEGFGEVGAGQAVECLAIALLESPEQELLHQKQIQHAKKKERSFIFGQDSDSAPQPLRPATPRPAPTTASPFDPAPKPLRPSTPLPPPPPPPPPPAAPSKTGSKIFDEPKTDGKPEKPADDDRESRHRSLMERLREHRNNQ